MLVEAYVLHLDHVAVTIRHTMHWIQVLVCDVIGASACITRLQAEHWVSEMATTFMRDGRCEYGRPTSIVQLLVVSHIELRRFLSRSLTRHIDRDVKG